MKIKAKKQAKRMEKKESVTSQVIKNSFWNFLMGLFAKAGGLIFVIILARLLLPEKFGIYNLAMTITLLLATFADFGINQTLIRYFAEALGKGRKKLAVARYRYLFKLKFLLTFSLSIFLLIFAYPLSIYIFKKPALFLPLLFLSIYLFISCFELFYKSFFYVLEKVGYITIKQALFETARIVLILIFFLLISTQYEVLGAVGILTVSVSIALIYSLYNLKRLTPFLFEKSKGSLKREEKKRINKFLVYMGIGDTSAIIFGYIDIVMIGLFLSSEYVGFYSAAWALSSGFAVLFSIAYILLPVFTKLKRQRLNEAFNKVVKYISIVTLPIIFGIFVLGKYIIRIIYGYEYLPATLPLYFLAFLIIEKPLTGCLTSLFSAREKPKYFVYILAIATLMNIVLNYILILSLLKISMTWAISGAAIATLISRGFYLFGLSIYSKKQLNLRFSITPVIKSLFSASVMALILFLINTQLTDITLIIGIGEVVLGALIYLLIMIIIGGIKKQDFELLKILKPKFYNRE
ncbi:MAG: flippase [Nanoarchaeota archaeon]